MGALVVVIATISLAEVARPLRFLDVPLGLWLVAAPWFLDGGTTASRWTDALVGLALVGLSWPMGALRDHYGSFDRVVAWTPFSRAQRQS